MSFDLDDMRRTLAQLRVAVDDIRIIVDDMLLPFRKRELGPVLHKQNYDEAHGKILTQLDYLRTLAAEPDQGDPSGCGDADPTDS